MRRGEFLEEIIERKGFNVMSLSKESGVAYTTIRSMIERDLKNASIDNVIKVCKVLGIKADDLSNEIYSESDVKELIEGSLPELTDKDEKDIQKELQNIINNLNSESGFAAFDGNVINDLDQEDKELLITSLEQTLKIAKRMAKQKFTPNKYKK